MQGDEYNTIVIEIGAHTIKSGFSGEDCISFRSIIGTIKGVNPYYCG